jgi:hypothetical protein
VNVTQNYWENQSNAISLFKEIVRVLFWNKKINEERGEGKVNFFNSHPKILTRQKR